MLLVLQPYIVELHSAVLLRTAVRSGNSTPETALCPHRCPCRTHVARRRGSHLPWTTPDEEAPPLPQATICARDAARGYPPESPDAPALRRCRGPSPFVR